ncbi:MAG: oligosaccharide flippase family protein [Bacillota bacterium]|nr:oligosaccharide flippase family protein [Bacillota bacterium]
MKASAKTIRNNFISLYGIMLVQMFFPFLLLPYLTRVLSGNAYGVVVYVGTCMQYVAVIMEYGFILSGTRDIVRLKKHSDHDAISLYTGSVFQAKGILALVSAAAALGLYFMSPILKEYKVYFIVSYLSAVLYSLLPDFLFRGLEIMHILAYRFVLFKGLSTLLKFILVKGDATMVYIPYIDFFAALVAFGVTIMAMRKRNLGVRWADFSTVLKRLKESSSYFLTNVATSQYNSVCVLILGLSLGTNAVAQWGVVMQVVIAVNSLYTPIINGIYPYMIREKNIGLIKKILVIAVPVLLFGGISMYFLAENVIMILAGELYSSAAYLLKISIPLMIIAFPTTLFGWPLLGAFGMENKVAKATVGALLFQVMLLAVLYLTKSVSLALVLMVRTGTDVYLLISRIVAFRKGLISKKV